MFSISKIILILTHKSQTQLYVGRSVLGSPESVLVWLKKWKKNPRDVHNFWEMPGDRFFCGKNLPTLNFKEVILFSLLRPTFHC